MFCLLAIWRIGGRSSNCQINIFDEDIVKIPDTGKKPRPIWPGGKIFCLDRSNMGFWFALARIIRGIKRTPVSADLPKRLFRLERPVNASIDPVPAGFAAEKERPSKPGHRQNQNDGSECDKKKTKYFHKLWDVLAERAQATITRNSMEPEQRRQRRLVRCSLPELRRGEVWLPSSPFYPVHARCTYPRKTYNPMAVTGKRNNGQ